MSTIIIENNNAFSGITETLGYVYLDIQGHRIVVVNSTDIYQPNFLASLHINPIKEPVIFLGTIDKNLYFAERLGAVPGTMISRTAYNFSRYSYL